jgi:nucleotide-binding universal stress UspA family protein
MNPWIVLLGLVLVAAIFVILPVGGSAFAMWRRPVRLTCPLTGTEAQLKVRPILAAIESVFGHDTPGIDRCSLWSTVPGCREECLALPAGARRSVPAGVPPPQPGAVAGVRTILVPLDGTPGSEEVLATVAALARVQGATVRLVRVVTPARAIPSDDGTRVVAFADQEIERQELETHAYLRGVAARLPGAAVESAVRFGDTVTRIIDEAEAAGADLIALASHRRRGLAALFRRSVAARLRGATRIPTLVVAYGGRRAA